MVDRLRSSLENLDPPECPHCRVEMKWFQSSLQSATVIEHQFVCDCCGRTTKRNDEFKAKPTKPPSKLSKRADLRAA